MEIMPLAMTPTVTSKGNSLLTSHGDSGRGQRGQRRPSWHVAWEVAWQAGHQPGAPRAEIAPIAGT